MGPEGVVRSFRALNESFGYRSIRPQQKTDTSLGVGGRSLSEAAATTVLVTLTVIDVFC
jgi:hypothetical protein